MPAASRLLPAGAVVVAAALSFAVRPSSDAVAAPVLADRGGQVYVLRCQSCHLASGLGQPAEGVPSLRGVGAAAVDFYVSTGRMPASDYSSQAPRRPVTVTPADTDADEISKYVAHQIERFEAGDALENVVDPARGY